MFRLGGIDADMTLNPGPGYRKQKVKQLEPKTSRLAYKHLSHKFQIITTKQDQSEKTPYTGTPEGSIQKRVSGISSAAKLISVVGLK